LRWPFAGSLAATFVSLTSHGRRDRSRGVEARIVAEDRAGTVARLRTQVHDANASAQNILRFSLDDFLHDFFRTPWLPHSIAPAFVASFVLHSCEAFRGFGIIEHHRCVARLMTLQENVLLYFTQ
jgi:hypothetical protein